MTSNLGIELDRLLARPLWDQLAATLRARILDGTVALHRKLPTEADLVSNLQVSRSTVTRALAIQRQEAIVRFEPGKGVYSAPGDVIAKAKRDLRKK